jgi:hypothetical protein
MATHERLDDDFPTEQPTSSWQRFVRSATTHLAVATLCIVITSGVCLQDRAEALADQKETFSHLAEDARCMAKDQAGTWYWIGGIALPEPTLGEPREARAQKKKPR